MANQTTSILHFWEVPLSKHYISSFFVETTTFPSVRKSNVDFINAYKDTSGEIFPRVNSCIEIRTLALPFAGWRPGRWEKLTSYLLASNRHSVSKFKMKSSLKLLKTIFTLFKATDLYYFLLLFVISVLNFKILCFHFVFLHGDDFSCRKGSSRHSASKSKIKSCVKLFTTTLALLKTIDVFYFADYTSLEFLPLKFFWWFFWWIFWF